ARDPAPPGDPPRAAAHVSERRAVPLDERPRQRARRRPHANEERLAAGVGATSWCGRCGERLTQARPGDDRFRRARPACAATGGGAALRFAETNRACTRAGFAPAPALAR